MARIQEFYKGRRKRRNYAFIPFIVLLAIISVTLVLFYGMQQYAVITKDGVSVELPIMGSSAPVQLDSQGHELVSFPKVDAEIIFDPPDYSNVKASAGEYLTELRAIFVPAENITAPMLEEYAARLNRGNALVLEMKPRSGEMLWESKNILALKYGLAPTTDRTIAIPPLIQALKEQKVYLVAQISCCIDERLSSSSSLYCIHTEFGANYRDDAGAWLDPYNSELRQATVEMIQELYDMGFDEVVLADLAHPVVPEETNLIYSSEISTARSPITAVCGYALAVAEHYKDSIKTLSIYTDTRPSLTRPDETTGQDARLFMKVYDRVFFRTDKSAYTYNIEDLGGSVELGKVNDRLVPVVENYIPDSNSSWILIDVEEE